jgi:predicted permease
MSWIKKLSTTLRPAPKQHELDDELAFHIEARADELMASGMDPAEAHAAATRMLGNRTGVTESTRDRDILVWLETFLQDLRYAARALRHNPGFAATAVFSLALGIGANTALFSMLDALLLRLLPVEQPHHLFRLSIATQSGRQDSLAYPLLRRIRKESKLFSGVFGMSSRSEQIEERGQTVPARVEVVTGEYFDVLGVTAARGRTFHLADTGFEAPSVAVISDSFWHAHYSGRDSAIGERLRAGSREYDVIGIAPPGYHGARIDWPVDVWVPVEQAVAPDAPQRKSSNWGWLLLAARLAPGATEAAAHAEADAMLRRHLEDIAGQTRFDHPQQRDALFAQRIAFTPLATGHSTIRERYGTPLLVIECIAGVVLLIACANLANLLLARATAREREIAVRQALGAGRWRLARQFLTESLLLAALGGGAALLVAKWLSAGMLRLLPDDLASALPLLTFHFDARVLAFTAALAILTCVLFGFAPAIRATRPAASRSSTESRSQVWTSRTLAAAEIALCTLLLMGCGLFLRTLRNLRTLDAGFAREKILVSTVGAPRGTKPERALADFEELRTRAAALPNVRGAGYSTFGLLTGDRITGDVDAEGHVPAAGEDLGATDMRVSTGYFRAMGTPLLTGRDFTDRDSFGAPQVAIVNESFVRKFFNGATPLGRHFGLDGPKSAGTIEIVGVLHDAKYQDLREKPAAIYYRPFAQVRLDTGMVLVVRADGDLRAVAAALQPVARSVNPGLTLRPPKAFAAMIDRTLLAERMIATFSTALGLLAVLVACVGLYGVLAYRVARRTREIGVRMALGASASEVLRMVLRESLAIFALGALLGVPLALGLARLVASLLFGLQPRDVPTLLATLTVLAAVSLAAAWLPARRAARVDPMTALRCE